MNLAAPLGELAKPALDMEDPTTRKLKSEIILAIQDVMEVFELSQADVARRTGLDPSAVSLMLKGKSHRVSVPSLIRAYNRLGGTIDIEFTSPESLPALAREGH
jgi:predicted XRE-type DNA-binding protein